MRDRCRWPTCRRGRCRYDPAAARLSNTSRTTYTFGTLLTGVGDSSPVRRAPRPDGRWRAGRRWLVDSPTVHRGSRRCPRRSAARRRCPGCRCRSMRFCRFCWSGRVRRWGRGGAHRANSAAAMSDFRYQRGLSLTARDREILLALCGPVAGLGAVYKRSARRRLVRRKDPAGHGGIHGRWAPRLITSSLAVAVGLAGHPSRATH